MFVETVDSLTFYSLLYCLYPGLRSGGERGGGTREQQSGGGNRGESPPVWCLNEKIKYFESTSDSICVSPLVLISFFRYQLFRIPLLSLFGFIFGSCNLWLNLQ